jgi:hypothetical protein
VKKRATPYDIIRRKKEKPSKCILSIISQALVKTLTIEKDLNSKNSHTARKSEK